MAEALQDPIAFGAKNKERGEVTTSRVIVVTLNWAERLENELPRNR